jgi:hypothetical protein
MTGDGGTVSARGSAGSVQTVLKIVPECVTTSMGAAVTLSVGDSLLPVVTPAVFDDCVTRCCPVRVSAGTQSMTTTSIKASAVENRISDWSRVVTTKGIATDVPHLFNKVSAD